MAGRARGDQPPHAELREGEAGLGERGWAQRPRISGDAVREGGGPGQGGLTGRLLGVATQVWLLCLPQFWEM